MTTDLEQLPLELNERSALEVAYGRDLYWIGKKLQTQASVLIECEKQLIPFVFMTLRGQMRDAGIQLEYLDGRKIPGSEGENPAPSILRAMLAQVTHWVRNASEQRILVLPHLDLLVSSSSQNEGLTTEARELIPLLYENPRIVFLAFKDPNFSFSKVIQNLFPAQRKLIGIDRSCLSKLVTQREARKFPKDFNFNRLYQYVSGLNPVRIRQILSRLEGIDFPDNPDKVFSQLREMTLDSEMEIPLVDMQTDLGGYTSVKDKIQEEILGILKYRDGIEDEEELDRIDSIIPKGIIFWGPPGTGKTYFAKAIAHALNATILIVSGPELKSMWVGQSEENIRKIFFKARQSAPSIIVFDELDSFAGSRSKLSTTEVNHSMVNQLLTEMDGFRKEELVFVIGTTNFVSSLDAALLRPGRFEMKLEIPYPEEKDRLEILQIYIRKMNLPLSEEQVQYMAIQTGEMTDPMTGTSYTGDHLYSACRFLKRLQIRENKSSFEKAEIHLALRGGEQKRKLSDEERNVVAYHEAGHAVVALCLKDASPVERISVDSDYAEALGYMKQEERKNKFMVTKRQLLADLIVLMGGREAELLIFNDLSSGSENDIFRANYLVTEMVSRWGMSEAFGVQIVPEREMSADALARRDAAVGDILEKARLRARQILEQRIELVKALGETVLIEKVMERERISEFLDEHAPGQKLNLSEEITLWQN
ncbi:MAG: AAA family ATPase [bacterium]|nr:AAA family ATPase [bacterium]